MMMNKIDKRLQKTKKEKRLGLMTHVVVGYPSLAKTFDIVKIMEKNGVDFVELQIPFSDPLADGTTIMKACESALKNGTKVKDAFDVVEKLSGEVKIPLLFMAYYNTVFKYGTEKFCKGASAVGIAGLIVPDMPIEEEQCEHFDKYCRKYNLKNIKVLSPSSTDERLEKNEKVASGFVYFTARQGITGAKDTLDPKIQIYLKKVKKYFSIPVAVGFGISKREHMRALQQHADIAVVGSAIIEVINKSKDQDIEKNVRSFIKNLKMVN